jgi:hypothetical protein
LMTLCVVSPLEEVEEVQKVVEEAFAGLPSQPRGRRGERDDGEAGNKRAQQRQQQQQQQSAVLAPPEAAWQSKGIYPYLVQQQQGQLVPPIPPPPPRKVFAVLAKPVAPVRELKIVWELVRPNLWYLSGKSDGAGELDQANGAGNNFEPQGAAVLKAGAEDILSKPALVVSNLLGHEGYPSGNL